MKSSRKRRLVDLFRSRQLHRSAVSVDDPVHRMRPASHGDRQFRASRFEWRLIRARSKREASLPRQSLVDPLLQKCDLLDRNPRSLRRHHHVGIVARQPLDQFAFGTLSHDEHFARLTANQSRFARVERQTTLLLIAGMTLHAVLFEDLDDLMREVDLRGERTCRDQQQAEGDDLLKCHSAHARPPDST